MNPEAKKVLDEILEKTIKELTPDEIEFLAGRRDYLKKVQLDEYAEVLEKRDKEVMAKAKIKPSTENQTSEEETVKPKHATR